MNQAAYRLEQTKLTDSKVFRDAVHNYIHVDQPLILDLINSHEMQRLRRIKQLGGTQLYSMILVMVHFRIVLKMPLI